MELVPFYYLLLCVMQLNSLQLECQKLWADKSLSFGCLYNYHNVILQIYPNNSQWFDDFGMLRQTYKDFWVYDNSDNDKLVDSDKYEIIWHPITYSRLCYLYMINTNITEYSADLWFKVREYFNKELIYMDKNILERPEELQLLVRDFLLSIS